MNKVTDRSPGFQPVPVAEGDEPTPAEELVYRLINEARRERMKEGGRA